MNTSRWLQRYDAVNQSLTIFLALPVALYLAMDSATSQQTAEALRYLQVKVPPLLHQPVIGIICGSGLKGLADAVLPEPRFEIPYADIPHFPQSTVHGHASKLLFGILEPGALPVVLMVGRVHFYEGHSIQSITFPIRLMKRLGVDTIIGKAAHQSVSVIIDRLSKSRTPLVV